MKRKILWLVVSCLMMVALVLASCGPAEEEEEVTPPPAEDEVTPPTEEEEVVVTPPEGEEMVKVKLTKADGTVVEKLLEKPRYGGILTDFWTLDPVLFDESFSHQGLAPSLYLTNDELLQGDWTKGPSGTGEISFQNAAGEHLSDYWHTGCLAESWEIIPPDTMVFHIRQGVHFHNKPPVNGREMTAYDVEYSLNRLFKTPTCYHYTAYPWDTHFGEEGYIKALDKWTVEIKISGARYFAPVYEFVVCHSMIIPQEVIEAYGDMNDWKVSIGTGPFMLTDYVKGSIAIFERNPDYWMKDPLNPDNSLPYVDTVKKLIIPDVSTQMAGLRTGKIDRFFGMSWEDADSFMKSNPELKYLKHHSGEPDMSIAFKMTEEPYTDIRVRQALTMAINFQEIVDSYYGGNAVYPCYPAGPLPEFSEFRVELDDLPEEIRELYSYHPDKAKQLLAEAGYPDGFKTEVTTLNTWVDMLSVIKDYWAQIGVDLEIKVLEYGSFWSVGFKKAYKGIWGYAAANGSLPFRFHCVMPGNIYNAGGYDNPRITDMFRRMDDAYFDQTERYRIMREEFYPAVLAECHVIQWPGSHKYHFWQPWVKGYSGEFNLGKKNYYTEKFLWIDQDVKEEMTGRR